MLQISQTEKPICSARIDQIRLRRAINLPLGLPERFIVGCPIGDPGCVTFTHRAMALSIEMVANGGKSRSGGRGAVGCLRAPSAARRRQSRGPCALLRAVLDSASAGRDAARSDHP